MKYFRFLIIRLLLTVWMAIVVFNSCEEGLTTLKPGDRIAVTGISLDKPTLTLLVGEEQPLMATIMPAMPPTKM